MAVFDRSWYGRLLVERIEGFATVRAVEPGLPSIVDFERTLVVEGVIVVKFWLHISDDEQLARFVPRADDPLQRWKFTDEDWRNRDRNRDYDVAAEEMFERTDHRLAPWDLIGAEQKRHARVQVLETLNARIEAGMQRWGTPVPSTDELSGFDVESPRGHLDQSGSDAGRGRPRRSGRPIAAGTPVAITPESGSRGGDRHRRA